MLDDLPVNANIDMVETNIDSDLKVKSDHHHVHIEGFEDVCVHCACTYMYTYTCTCAL